MIDNNSFDFLELKDNLLRGIYAYGFEYPSLIQLKSIPLIRDGKDVIAQSQSGTGKTGAFTIGTLQRIDESIVGCQALIIAHTRELAEQISNVFYDIGQYLNIKIVLCIGGQNIHKSKLELENGNIILVGTPGRIIDLINRKYLQTDLIRLLIIDEADEMLSANFQDQIKSIISFIPNDAQICLFSATMPEAVIILTEKFMNKPETILIQKEYLTLDGIKQFYINVETELWKFETFCDLFDIISVSQTIVYINTIKKGDDLKYQLEKKNFTVSLIHSNMDINIRNKIMKEFRSGETRILLATDLLSRGIDIQQISVVVNYDIPKNKDCYIHRIGRSGRFGRKGVAINLITKYEEQLLQDIKNYYITDIDPLPTNIQQYIN